MDLSAWTASDYAAWWGAVIATLALAWNIVVALRAGARVKVRATPNMMIMPRQPVTGDRRFIFVTAVNRGSAPTTITHFLGFHAASVLHLIRRNREHFAVNTGGGLGLHLPYVLQPGQEWQGMADQQELAESFRGGFLFVGVQHNQRNRAVYVRVRLPKPIVNSEGGADG